MAQPNTPARCFIASHLAWYAAANNYTSPSFMFGLFDEDDRTLDGEITMAWENGAAQLSCYSDALHALVHMNDVTTALLALGDDYTAEQFTAVLLGLGFVDITDYTNPDGPVAPVASQPESDLRPNRWKPAHEVGDVVDVPSEGLKNMVVSAREYDDDMDRWLYHLQGHAGLFRSNLLLKFV